VRAGFSRYHYDSLLRNLKSANIDGLGISTYGWNDPSRDGRFQIDERGQLLKVQGARFSRLDPEIKPPHANEVHLGLSQALPGDFHLILSGYRRVDRDLQAYVNTGVPAGSFSPVIVFDPGNDGASATGDEAEVVAYNQSPETVGKDSYILTNSFGESAFAEGYEARILRRGYRFQFELAFTRYRSVARTAPGNGFRENDWSSFYVINDPNQSIHSYGSTFFDRGLEGRFWGIVRINRRTRFAWITSYLDGAPYGRILPVQGLNQGLVGILATPRGPGNGSIKGGKRTAHNLTLDLRITREYRLGRGSLGASLDVFNLLNKAHALSEADVTSPAHLWRIPLRYQTPRSLQLGVGFRW
jgi:hypothetical protein